MTKKISVFLLIFFAVLASFPLFHPGLIPTHDGEYHVIRFYEFYKTVQSGYWYPRWAFDLNFKHGVPLFNYVYPLPNYLALLFHFVGFSFIDSFKLIMSFSLIVGSLFFFEWLLEFVGVIGAFCGALLYIFTPYHFLDIYIRGSVGEVLALGLFPGYLWSITRYIRKGEKNYAIFSSVFLALIILSHNILALMFFGFSLFYVTFLLFKEKKQSMVKQIIMFYVLGLGLSAIFWIPALLEQKYTVGLQVFSPTDSFPDLYQLLFPSWGSGFTTSDFQNQLSVQIGIINLLVIFFSTIFLPFKRQKKSIVIFFLISFLVSTFLILSWSKNIWLLVPFMNYFQFPWRFLSLTLVITAFLGGIFISGRISKIIGIILIFSSIPLTIGYTKPAYYLLRNDNYYVSRSNFIDGTNSPGNSFNTIWYKANPQRPIAPLSLVGGDILSTSGTTSNYKALVSIKDTNSLAIYNVTYFPSWVLFIDSKKIDIKPSQEGLIQFKIPKGKHIITARLLETPIEEFSTFVSLVSFLCILVLFTRPALLQLKNESRNRHKPSKKRKLSTA